MKQYTIKEKREIDLMARKKEKRPFWLLLRPGKSDPSGAFEKKE